MLTGGVPSVTNGSTPLPFATPIPVVNGRTQKADIIKQVAT